MVGADASTAAPIQGDASITVDFVQVDADVAFTNILDLGTGVGLSPINWAGLSIEDDGSFGSSTLRGTFYGPNHEEVGGAFQATSGTLRPREIIGSFGAARN